jgi:hypothetical protein
MRWCLGSLVLATLLSFAVSVVFAQVSPDIEVAKARTIVDLDNKLNAAVADIQKAKAAGSDLGPFEEKMKAAQEKLDQAVKASYYGFPTRGGCQTSQRT